MSGAVKLETVQTSCNICEVSSDEQQLFALEDFDAELPPGDVPLKLKIAALNQNKLTIGGRICTTCAQSATDAYAFQVQLKGGARIRENSLTEKIRVLRRRLHELAQRVDVFIVVGGETGNSEIGGADAKPSYTENDIVVVDRDLLAAAIAADESGDTIEEATDAPYQCSVCPQSFQKASLYQEHYAQHPADAVHSCWTCGKQFNNKETLEVHAKQHRQANHLLCHICDQLFQTENDLRRHECISDGIDCPICGEKMDGRGELSAHAIMKHSRTSTPPHLCPSCFMQFDSSDALSSHLLIHRREKQYVCGYDGCILRFSARDNLMTHIRKCHRTEEEAVEEPEKMEEEEQPITSAGIVTCDICQRAFGSIAALKRHSHVHEAVRRPRKERGTVTQKSQKIETQPTMVINQGHIEVNDTIIGDPEYLEVEYVDEDLNEEDDFIPIIVKAEP